MKSKDMVRVNISLDRVRAAKAGLRQHLGKSVEIVGIGVTGREGRYAFEVNVRRMPKGRILPSEIDGVPLKFEVVGAIRRNARTVRIRSVKMRVHNPPHPGELIREECLVPLGLTIAAAARALGVTRKALSELANGHSGISPEMAIRLSKAFGSEPETWLGM